MNSITYSMLKPKMKISVNGDYNCIVIPGHSIRIWGTQTNHINGPRPFDKTFKLGDEAIYDRFNFIYTGPITAIGPSSVTILASDTGRGRKRLELYWFADRNWGFNKLKIESHNNAEMMCI